MTAAWEGRRRAAVLARVKAQGARNHTPCVLCGQPIDYRLRYPDPWSCSVQHVKPRRDHPELIWDPANHAPAHLQCNKAEPKSEPRRNPTPPDLGVLDMW